MLAAILVRRKLLLALLVLAAVPAVYFAFFARAPVRLDPDDPQAATAQGLAPPDRDAAVYRTLQEYIYGLVADDRPVVLALLTEAHRETFGEGSFLLQAGAREAHSEIRLARLDHSFPTFTAQFPGMDGVMVAVLSAEYTVHFVRDGRVVQTPRFREELLLREEGGRWLIAASRRDFLAQDGSE